MSGCEFGRGQSTAGVRVGTGVRGLHRSLYLCACVAIHWLSLSNPSQGGVLVDMNVTSSNLQVYADSRDIGGFEFNDFVPTFHAVDVIRQASQGGVHTEVTLNSFVLDDSAQIRIDFNELSFSAGYRSYAVLSAQFTLNETASYLIEGVLNGVTNSNERFLFETSLAETGGSVLYQEIDRADNDLAVAFSHNEIAEGNSSPFVQGSRMGILGPGSYTYLSFVDVGISPGNANASASGFGQLTLVSQTVPEPSTMALMMVFPPILLASRWRRS